MEISSAFKVTPSEGEKPGAFAAFPYDRDLVRRFREVFPRARWRGDEQCWFVPGTTAVRRLDAWMSRELETLDRYADDKGRDAFLFEPLSSPYLTVADDLRVRTPYSKTVVEAMRAIPWARWDPERRIWRVPFRSYEELLGRWPEIEEAARRNEPEAKRLRREEKRRRGIDKTDIMQRERRRRRYPVPGDDLPPLGQPVATLSWGVVVFEEIVAEPLTEPSMRDLYPHLREPLSNYVWAHWRMPILQELYRTKSARESEDPELRASRGWWLANRNELQERARQLRQMERAARSRNTALDA
ncbi:hypothetical protein [Microvirga sp. 2TAF3]|uniref:hypothetical protein n=1 Tax=Microvirga sp. 2TAF3 TaxID=3233014 RepID=UPI003F9A12E2